MRRLIPAIVLGFLTFVALIGVARAADSPPHGDHAHHHPKHNMVLVGTDEVFASHIVYKQPHNFQVIVGIDIPEPLASTYRAARAAHPDDTFILLLDPIDIGDLASEASLSGPVFHRDAAGNRIDLGSVVIPRGAFKVLYSEELPLSLEP